MNKPQLLINIPNVGVFTTHKEVFGWEANIADVVQLIAPFSIHNVLRVIALANNCFSFAVDMKQFQSTMRQTFQLASLPDQPSNSPLLVGNPIIFHRQQLLMLLHIALLSCKSEGGVWDESSLQAIGKACLMVNDFAGQGDDTPAPSSQFEHASVLLPMTDLPNDQSSLSLVGRSCELWITVPATTPELKSKPDYIPFGEKFEEQYDISIKDFILSVCYLLAKCEGFDPSSNSSLEALVFKSSILITLTTFPQNTFEKAVRLISCKISDMKKRLFLEPRQSAQFDFTTFRKFPILEVHDDVFIIYDIGFLRKVLTDGLYWLIYNLLDKEERRHFQGHFGRIVEYYTQRVIDVYAQSCSNPPKVIRNLNFSNSNKGDEVCDVLIESGKSWVMVEAKGSLFTTRAKYAGDAVALENDMKAKFMSSDKGVNKGSAQLANSLNKLLDGQPLKDSTVDVKNLDLIYPVIVSYDSALTSYFLPEILQDNIESLLHKKQCNRPSIRPLTVMSIADLELMTGLIHKPDFCHVLASYHNLKLPTESFGNFLTRYYKGKISGEGTVPGNSYEAVYKDAEKYFKSHDASEEQL